MRLFISSTYIDLKDVRRELQDWLIGVFGAELIVMETFGSDIAPPDMAAVSRVRGCDLFIGITTVPTLPAAGDVRFGS